MFLLLHVSAARQGRACPPSAAGPGDKITPRALQILSPSRHQYVRQLAQSSLRGRIDAAKKGRWLTRAPWGYRLENGRLVIDPATADVARWIFAHYADSEDGVLRIADALNERGVTPPGGKGMWTANAVHNVLRNPVCLGDTVFGRRVSGKFFAMVDLRPAPRSAVKGKRVQ
jgi:site-specific DNA recombinase